MTDASDLIDFDSLLTTDEIVIRDRVRTFVTTVIRPNIADWDDGAVFST